MIHMQCVFHNVLQDDSEFVFEPSFGEIKPLETKKVKVIFRPTKCQSLRSIFEVRVEDGNDRSVVKGILSHYHAQHTAFKPKI